MDLLTIGGFISEPQPPQKSGSFTSAEEALGYCQSDLGDEARQRRRHSTDGEESY